jgi:hypothetical protein
MWTQREETGRQCKFLFIVVCEMCNRIHARVPLAHQAKGNDTIAWSMD